jgi:hypothetical protein
MRIDCNVPTIAHFSGVGRLLFIGAGETSAVSIPLEAAPTEGLGTPDDGSVGPDGGEPGTGYRGSCSASGGKSIPTLLPSYVSY